MIIEQLPWPLYGLLHDSSDDSDVLTRQKSMTSLLAHYDGSAPPPSARVHPHIEQRESSSFGLWHMVKFSLLAASKATEIASDVVSHTLWGPKKKSWGIEMTLLSSIMRDIGQHSSLIDLSTLRIVMGLSGYFPLPSDALVTPLTFRVRKRKLRGILADLDSLEDGTRELSGEWVVGKKIWQRLQGEWKAARKASTPSRKADVKNEDRDRVVFYLHGGAYYASSAAAQRLVSIPLSKYTEYRVFALDYRLAPETNFPGPLHDAVSGYFRLTEDLHIPAQNIILAGDSAGGGLALALMLYLRDNNYPLPSAAILMSPWVDLTMSCDSWESNAMYDIVPVVTAGDPLNPVGLYLGKEMDKYLTHPYASPLFGDLKGLPPMLIQSGDSEVLRDEITLLAHKATLAGGQVQHELYEDAVHVFHSFPFLDQSRRAFVSMRDYVQNVLPGIQIATPKPLDRTAEDEMQQEIDNEDIRVVRGDGVETGTGRKRAESISQTNPSRPRSEADDSESSSDELPSWGRAAPSVRSRSSSSLSSINLGDESQPREESPPPPILRRIQSATHALFAEDPVQEIKPHRRPRRMTEAQGGPGRISISNLTMSPVTDPSPVTSPSIRRSKSTASHPDLTSLVEQFNTSGPANETTVYRPRLKARQNSYFRI